MHPGFYYHKHSWTMLRLNPLTPEEALFCHVEC
jgi:hypothetical protein